MNIRKISIKPCNHGYDPNLMVAYIEQVAESNPDFGIKSIAHGAVALYCKMADLVATNGGEIEVPEMKHIRLSKEGSC